MTVVPFFIPHQGCPHRCLFCNQRAQTGAGDGLPDGAALCAAIDDYRRSSGDTAVEVAFFGGTFTALPVAAQKKLLAPLQPLLANGTVSGVRISTRPDSITPDGIRFLRSMGVATVELGVQSMADRVLAIAGRGHTASDTVRAAGILRDAGIRTGMQLLPGLPGDTPATSRETLRAVLELSPSFIRIYPLLVLNGTELARLYHAGVFVPWSLEEAVRVCTVLLQDAEQAGVPVIRVGVQATDELAVPGMIVAGPWHPAFRQLVEGTRWFDLVALLAAGVPPGIPVELGCAPGRRSDLVGQRRTNAVRWEPALGLRVARVAEDATLGRWECRIRWDGGERRASLLEDLTY